MMKTVVFLCPHNAAKSVIAKAYFDKLIDEKKLDFVATSSGTEPGKAVSPQVVQLMNEENIDVSHHVPRSVTTEELQSVWKIVSLGCDVNKLGSFREKMEAWDDIPPPSHDLIGARDAIRRRIETLVEEIEPT